MPSLYRSVLILVVLIMLIYVPLCIATMVVMIDVFIGSKDVNQVAYSMYVLSVLPLYLNCVINALVILWFNKVAKQWVLNKMRSRFSKRTRETANTSNDVGICGETREQRVVAVAQVLNS